MATYRIACTVETPSGHSIQQTHIVAVGVGESAADAVTDNNLDSLRPCA
jgi:hypothetical protein